MAWTLALFGLAAAVLLWEGMSMRSWLSARGISGCVSPAVNLTSARCYGKDWFSFVNQSYYASDLTQLLQVIPAVIAMFAGVRWLTREYESATFRYTWAQGVSPGRWAAGTLLPLAGTAIAGAAGCGLAFSWWYRVAQWPLYERPAGGWSWQTFDLPPVTLASLTILAMALAALAGSLIRRTLPAMAVTAVSYTAAVLLADWQLRPRLISLMPVTARAPWGAVNQLAGAASVPHYGDLFFRGWFTGPNGHVLAGWLDTPQGTQITGPHAQALTRIANLPMAAANKWFALHHYTHWATYQPHSRLWLFQAAWAAALLVLSAASAAGAIWCVRARRP